MQMDGDESSNIEDRRDGGGGFGGGGLGGGFRIPMGGGGGGGVFTGGLGVVGFIVLALLFGADPGEILGGMTGGDTTTSAPAPSSSVSRPAQTPAADAETQFVARVLKSTETVWSDIFRDMGKVYREPKLVLFRDATRTDCGVGQAAMGPFYCPADQRVYLDLGFFDELAQRFRAPGQFPQAYVISHEIGHHVQNLLGISGQVQQMRQSMSKRDGNALSVRTELQADCFAGVWANRADRQRGGKMIDDKDVDQAMAAAAAIGDDKLQRQTQGRIVPDSFTHGSSAQRTRWFRVGLDSGDYRKCDTFRAQQL